MSLPPIQELDLSPPADPLSRTDRPSARGQARTGAEAGLKPFGEDGFSFFDLLDVVNPLQHIPIVSTIYRRLTGDTLDALPRIAGGALFGGVIGFATSAVNAMIDGATGKDVGEHVLAFLGDPLAPETEEPVIGFADAADFPSGARDRDSAAPQPLVIEAPPSVVPVTVETLPEISLTSAPPGPPMSSPHADGTPHIPPDAAGAIPVASSSALPGLPGMGMETLSERSNGGSPVESIDFQRMHALAADEKSGLSPPPDDPIGSIADDGGWFTLIMLQALQKYEAGGRLVGEHSEPKPTVSILQ